MSIRSPRLRTTATLNPSGALVIVARTKSASAIRTPGSQGLPRGASPERTQPRVAPMCEFREGIATGKSPRPYADESLPQGQLRPLVSVEYRILLRLEGRSGWSLVMYLNGAIDLRTLSRLGSCCDHVGLVEGEHGLVDIGGHSFAGVERQRDTGKALKRC